MSEPTDIVERLNDVVFVDPSDGSDLAYEAAAEIKRLRSENKIAVEALENTSKVLTVPAAEYVPAISDAFTVIDNALARIRKMGGE